jgi:hypothetical protein
MILLPWNIFFLSLLHFVVVRCDHDEGLVVRISPPLKPINGIGELGRFRSIFLILRWQKKDTGKKKFMLNSAYRSVGRRSLDIYSSA